MAEFFKKLWEFLLAFFKAYKPDVPENVPPPSVPEPTQPTPEPEAKPQPKAPPRGVWIWDGMELEGNYVEELAKAGVERVYLKVMDDGLQNGVLWDTANIIPKFVARGIQVWAWGYHFTGGKTPNAALVLSNINKCLDLGIRGYVFDLEGELKNNPSRTNLCLTLIKHVCNGVKSPLTIGVSSFGAVDMHPDFPWKKLDEVINCWFPQIYYDKWEGKASKLIAECLIAHAEAGITKPIYPVFSCEPGKQPYPRTVAEHQESLDAYPGSSMWRIHQKGESTCTYQLKFHGNPVAVPVETKPKPEPKSEPKPTDIESALLAMADLAEAEGKKGLVWSSEKSEADKYLKPLRPYVGGGRWPWCGAFVTWCGKQKGVPIPYTFPTGYTPAYCPGWVAWAKKNGTWYPASIPTSKFNPRRGDIVLFDWNVDRDPDHIGIVLSYDGKRTLKTAEGNTSQASNSNGNATAIRTRDWGNVLGFIRLK